MDHVAYMKPAWHFLPKILSGQKIIESRWYLSKRSPWGQIQSGDTVFFKDTGQPVTAKATAKKILAFENLTPAKIMTILWEYGQADGINQSQVPVFYERFKNKKYCLLIFLKNPEAVPPFEVNKKGFGAMSAWITIPDVHSITRPY